ncbi:MAG: nucleotidyltransferase family protein [Patescibacteria group bacterium]
MLLNIVSNIDVFILCGGKGERLRSSVSDRPKVLADINGKPFLEILVENLAAFGFKRIILGVGYLKEQIIGHFKDYNLKNPDLKIEFSEENHPLGTGGAVKKIEPFIKSGHFIVMNGDAFFDLDFGKFHDYHLKNNSLVSIALTRIEDASDCGIVDLNDGGRITAFKEKIPVKKAGLINAGIYLMNKEIFSHMPLKDVFSLEYDLFPQILEYSCYGFIGEGKFIDIGVPNRYEKAKKLLTNN